MSKNHYVVTEGVEGNWSYHISHKDKISESLCGKRTMCTELDLQEESNKFAIGYKEKEGHIPESYCKECYAIFKLMEFEAKYSEKV